jgi:hypothetical protein
MVQRSHANLLGSHETPNKASSRPWLAKVPPVSVHVWRRNLHAHNQPVPLDYNCSKPFCAMGFQQSLPSSNRVYMRIQSDSRQPILPALVPLDMPKTETLPFRSFSINYAAVLAADKCSSLAWSMAANDATFLLGKDAARSFQRHKRKALIKLIFLPSIPPQGMRKRVLFLVQSLT